MNLKVFIHPSFNPEDKGEGGIRRVWEAQHKYLPEYGVEFVSNEEEADVVNIHALSHKTDKPVVFSNHGLYWSSHDWPAWAYKANRDIIDYMKLAHVKSITAPSHWVAHSLSRGLCIKPRVVYHGIDIDEWQPGRNAGYVVWAKNRVDSICNPDPLNKLAELNPKIGFISTFGNSDLKNLNTTGRVPFETAKNMIQNAGVYLANVEETGGITVMEAMASGVPILAYNHGVNPELITHQENGYLVEPGNIEQLNEGLDYCLQHRDRLGKAARQTIVEKFQWYQVIGGYYSAYRDAIIPHEGPKVSVIITAYNLEEYLPHAIESVVQQDTDDWELIIVDDASPDNCGAIADFHASHDGRIRVIHNPHNVYLAEARNVGIRQARGKYILPLDADDMLAPYAVRVLSDALDRDKEIHIVTGSMELIEPEGNRWVSTWPWDEPTYQHQISGKNMVPYASMYRREVWERIGGYRRRCRTAEDADFWTRAMSYGARPAKVTQEPTLIYRNRPESMSHTEGQVDWTAWFTWAKHEYMTPYGAPSPANDKRTYPVHKYGLPKISVVIPVGPGHDIYLQDCLDSLVSQTFLDWEAIVVNDTGKQWFDGAGNIVNPYIEGFPFVRFIDGNKSVGTAGARNKGILASRADLIVFLDADDYAQSIMLDVLYKAQRERGGWVYTDFYDQEGNEKNSRDWDASGLMDKMLGPVTGIYPKDALLSIGGFDVDADGWEDYIMQLGLLNLEVCGSRVALPLFTYRYHTGINRNRDFENRKDLLQYIHKKYNLLYERGDHFMACKSCRRGGGAKVLKLSGAARKNVMANANVKDDGSNILVELEYVGSPQQQQSLKSKVDRRVMYNYSGRYNRIYVLEGDVEWMTDMSDFKLAEKDRNVVPSGDANLDLPRLTADRDPAPIPIRTEREPKTEGPRVLSGMNIKTEPKQTAPKPVNIEPPPDMNVLPQELFNSEDGPDNPVFAPISQLEGVSPSALTIIEESDSNIKTIMDLHLAPVSALVLIKGIGKKRAEELKEAARAVVESVNS